LERYSVKVFFIFPTHLGDLLVSEIFSPARLIEAAKDYRYLLHRGYKQHVALRIVSEHYRLSENERYILLRAVFPFRIARMRIIKKVSPSTLPRYTLSVDGYNVLITIESFLLGRLLLLCDDGFIRDIAGVFRKYRISEATKRALLLMILAIKELQPKTATIILDEPISRSGELAAMMRKMLMEYSIRGTAKTSKSPDREILESGDVVATSDTVLIDKAKKVLDLAGYVILKNVINSSERHECKARIISLRRTHGDLYVGFGKNK